MKRLMLILAFFSFCARPLLAQSPLAQRVAQMAPGSWSRFYVNGFSIDMIFGASGSPPGTNAGGIGFAMNGVWDSSRKVAYFWSGVHASAGTPYDPTDWCNSPAYGTPSGPTKCADLTQRFFKYEEATNNFSEILDMANGAPHSDDSVQTGGHPYNDLALDPATGDVYKSVHGTGRIKRYGVTTAPLHQWTTIANQAAMFESLNLSPMAWFPDADGLIYVSGQNARVQYWQKSTNTWFNIKTSVVMGYYNLIAIYNPIKHEMIFGSGAGALDPNDNRKFYILKYTGGDPTNGANWTLTARTIPLMPVCTGGDQVIFSAGGEISQTTLDPASGNYLMLTRDMTCDPVIQYSYNSTADTWTLLTGSNVPPPIFSAGDGKIGKPGSSTPGNQLESVPIDSYGGFVMYVMQSSYSTDRAQVWLYKPTANITTGTPDTTAPPTPTNLHTSGVGAKTIELMWNYVASDGTLAGYNVYRNGTLVSASFWPFYQDVEMTPNTSYTYQVKAYDAAGNESGFSNAVTATTGQLFTYAQKCDTAAFPGVLSCTGWDNTTDFKYNWPRADPPGNDWWAGNICNNAMGPPGQNFTYYNSVDPAATTSPGNITSSVVNGQCVWPSRDTAIKHDGAASIRFPTPNHSGATVGEYYGFFKQFGIYPNETFAYTGAVSVEPDPSAVHAGDDLWIQFYIRNDHGMVNQAFNAFAYAQHYQTAGMGATQVTVFQCDPATWLTAGIPPDAVGKHIIFDKGDNFVLNTQFTIVSLQNPTTGNQSYCAATLNASPTPSGAGGTYPFFGDGYIDGGPHANGWKVLGVFGQPITANSHYIISNPKTCCGPATQVLTSCRQTGTTCLYSYLAGTTEYTSFYGLQPTRTWAPLGPTGCPGGYTTGLSPDFDDGTLYPEPPCLRFLPDKWQEITIHIKTFATGNCQRTGIYQQWVDGQLAWDLSDFGLCWGADTSVSPISYREGNGLGQFNFSPYHTAKDPNQNHPDTFVNYDSLIISTQPIPMGSDSIGSGCSGDCAAPTVNITAPMNGATVMGPSVSITADAMDNVAVVGVQFMVDGVNLGPEDTTSPYSAIWNTTTFSNGSHSVSAMARDAVGNKATSIPVTVTVNNCTSGDCVNPTVSITAPANNASVTGNVTVTATASDNVGVVGVQFKLDGSNLGAEVTTAPYQVSWSTTLTTNGTHALSATARDAAGNLATHSISVTVANCADCVAPSVTLTSPANGALITGTISLTATCTDNVNVANVQFRVDAADIGAPSTSVPYGTSWNSTTVGNGAHTLSAVCKDTSNNAATSTINVTVANGVTTPNHQRMRRATTTP